MPLKGGVAESLYGGMGKSRVNFQGLYRRRGAFEVGPTKRRRGEAMEEAKQEEAKLEPMQEAKEEAMEEAKGEAMEKAKLEPKQEAKEEAMAMEETKQEVKQEAREEKMEEIMGEVKEEATDVESFFTLQYDFDDF